MERLEEHRRRAEQEEARAERESAARGSAAHREWKRRKSLQEK